MIILKNIKYKGKSIKRGTQIKIDKKDIEEFIQKGIINPNDLVKNSANEGEDIADINDITKAEIIEILTEKGIEHNPRDKKEVLYRLMIEGD